MQRYAIYYMPAEHTPLWRFGSSVLGFDAATFTDVDYPDHPMFRDPESLGYTAAPRRYGFHATLKAPFRLAEGRDAGKLERRLEDFATGQETFDVTLKLATLGDFFALVSSDPIPQLDRLAEACVRDFDAFRAPLTPEDRERRHPERLTPRQLENLDRWGYPFVFDDFRFHMTLSGSLTLDDQIRLGPVLDELFQTIPPTIAIDAVALFVQDEAEGRFRVRARFPFKDAG